MKKVFLSVALMLCVTQAKIASAAHFWSKHSLNKKNSIIFTYSKKCKVNHLQDNSLTLLGKIL